MDNNIDLRGYCMVDSRYYYYILSDATRPD